MNSHHDFKKCLLILLGVTAHAFASTAQSPAPETVLQAFRDSCTWTDCVVFHAELSGTTSTTHYSEKSTYYNDHGRQISFTVTERAQNALTGEALGVGRAYRSIFSEQLNGFFHTISVVPEDYTKDFEGTLYSYEDGFAAYRYHLARQPSLSPFFGVNVLFSYEAVHDLLTPDVVKLREDSHNGRRSVVIEAQLPEGHIELWVAPDRGYTMQKYRLTKVAGEDLDSGGSIFQPETYFSRDADKTVPLKRLVIEGIVEEEQQHPFAEYVIPTQLKKITRFENEDGTVDHEEIFVNTISKIDFNPDFEALKAFEFSVPNGTSTIPTKKNGQRMVPLKWYDGEFVIDTNNEFYEDRLSETVGQLTSASAVKEEPSETLWLQMSHQRNSQTLLKRHFPTFAVVVAMLVILMSGWVVYRMMKRRRKSK